MNVPRFEHVTVLFGDPRLPDPTKVGSVFSAEDLEAMRRACAALRELPGYRWQVLDDHRDLAATLQRQRPAFVLNLCDTGFRNRAALELHVPALLEMLDVPYSGCGPACLGLCFDKANVRSIAADCGVPVPAQVFVAPDDDAATVELPLPLPAIVKPNRGDGGFGITAASVVDDAAAARARIGELRQLCPQQGILVQEFLRGTEYAVALIGNADRGFLELPLLEVDYGGLDPALPRILGYESKTHPDSPYWTDLRFRPATLDARAQAALVAHCRHLFERLGCRDYARFDFRCGDDGRPRLLEVNPNPAWCWDGKLNMIAGWAGLGYAQMLGAILQAAQARY